jgi:hypothetical protein
LTCRAGLGPTTAEAIFVRRPSYTTGSGPQTARHVNVPRA